MRFSKVVRNFIIVILSYLQGQQIQRYASVNFFLKIFHFWQFFNLQNQVLPIFQFFFINLSCIHSPWGIREYDYLKNATKFRGKCHNSIHVDHICTIETSFGHMYNSAVVKNLDEKWPSYASSNITI